MKRLSLCLIAVLFFFNMGAICYASSAPYVGNKSTKVYHIVECSWSKKIGAGNRIYFDSRESAEIRGYRRCYYCGDGFVEEGNGGGSAYGSSGNSGNSGNSGSSGSGGELAAKKESNKPDTLSLVFFGGIVLWLTIYLIKNKSQLKANSTNAIRTSPPPAMKESAIAGPELKSELKSSVIKKATYNSKGLCIEFTNGSTYIYYSAPQWVYDGLIRAKSPGSYFHENIKDTYPYEIYRK